MSVAENKKRFLSLLSTNERKAFIRSQVLILPFYRGGLPYGIAIGPTITTMGILILTKESIVTPGLGLDLPRNALTGLDRDSLTETYRWTLWAHIKLASDAGLLGSYLRWCAHERYGWMNIGRVARSQAAQKALLKFLYHHLKGGMPS